MAVIITIANYGSMFSVRVKVIYYVGQKSKIENTPSAQNMFSHTFSFDKLSKLY